MRCRNVQRKHYSNDLRYLCTKYVFGRRCGVLRCLPRGLIFVVWGLAVHVRRRLLLDRHHVRGLRGGLVQHER